MIRLNDNQKIKLKKLYLNKEYSKFQLEIEKLGDLESLPDFLKLGYAGSLVINNLSKKKDFLCTLRRTYKSLRCSMQASIFSKEKRKEEKV